METESTAAPASGLSRKYRDIAILIILGALLFIPFLGDVHLFDWDEINFAEASREMIVTGNYTRVQIGYRPFWEKPPLFFWLQVLSMKTWGINEFAARFVNAVFGILTLVIAYLMGCRLYDRRMGIFWALAFCGAFFTHLFFKSGIIDPVFNLFIFCSIWFLSRVTDNDGRFHNYILAGLLAGAAVLTKGPVAVLLISVTTGAFWFLNRKQEPFAWKGLFAFAGTAAAVSALWFGPETVKNGTWFIEEFIRYHIRLLSTGDAGHGRPFWFHFAVLLFGCFPVSILAIRSFWAKPDESYTQKNFKKWMIILFWTVMIIFSIVKTKTVLYASLTWYPAAFLAAYMMYNVTAGKLKWAGWQTFVLGFFCMLTGTVLAAFPWLIDHKEIILPFIKDRFAAANLQRPVAFSGKEWIIGAVYLGVLLVSLRLIMNRKMTAAFYTLLLSSAACLAVFTAVLMPKAEQFTQGGPVAFYKSLQGEDVHIKVLFKTYADIFYARKRPEQIPEDNSKKWFLTGPIDKPVCFVSRMNQKKKYAGKYGLPVIKEEYGFVYYRREVPVDSADTSVAH